MVFYFDMDGVLVDVPEIDGSNFKKLSSPFWVSNLPPYSYNVQVINWLISQGHTVYILSRGTNSYNKKGKLVWLEKYVPKLPKDHIILIDDAKKENYVRERGVLIDDIERNCKFWFKCGMPAYYVNPRGANIDVKKLLSIRC